MWRRALILASVLALPAIGYYAGTRASGYSVHVREFGIHFDKCECIIDGVSVAGDDEHPELFFHCTMNDGTNTSECKISPKLVYKLAAAEKE